MVPLRELEGHETVAAADAFAEHDKAGIGGWWIHAGLPLCPENICWFSYQLQREDLPEWFKPDKEQPQCGLAGCIAALEALAQLVLMECRSQSHLDSSVGRCVLRQLCDTAGVVAASATALNMRAPLCYVLQALGHVACENGGIS